MAVVVDEDNVLIALGEMSDIIESDVYYNNGHKIIQVSSHPSIAEEGLKNIFNIDVYTLCMYEKYNMLHEYIHSFKINYVFDKSLYSKSYNPKISITQERIIFVEERTNELIVLNRYNRVLDCFDLPDYKLFLGIKHYYEADDIKIHYITHDNVFASKTFNESESSDETIKYHAIIQKPNFQYVKRYIIKNDIVYKFNKHIFDKIINRLVDLVGNTIFILDDEKYYYCCGTRSLEELDLDYYLPYIEDNVQVKSARKN